jgi:glycine/D-amino acid oxidase-like deaminating enzyme
LDRCCSPATTSGPADSARRPRRDGLPGYAEYLTRGRLQKRFGIARAGAILSPGNLALDPRKLTAGLLLCAIERGARCPAPTKATTIEAGRLRRVQGMDGARYAIQTGRPVRSSKVRVMGSWGDGLRAAI